MLRDHRLSFSTRELAAVPCPVEPPVSAAAGSRVLESPLAARGDCSPIPVAVERSPPDPLLANRAARRSTQRRARPEPPGRRQSHAAARETGGDRLPPPEAAGPGSARRL